MGIQKFPLRKTRFRTPLDFIARRLPRMVCSFDTVIKTADETAVPVRVFNFSEGGFMIVCPETLRSGTEITLSLHGLGDTKARILWASDSQAGGVFKDPINVDQLINEIDALEQA
jgi:PilZ domain